MLVIINEFGPPKIEMYHVANRNSEYKSKPTEHLVLLFIRNNDIVW